MARSSKTAAKADAGAAATKSTRRSRRPATAVDAAPETAAGRHEPQEGDPPLTEDRVEQTGSDLAHTAQAGGEPATMPAGMTEAPQSADEQPAEEQPRRTRSVVDRVRYAQHYHSHPDVRTASGRATVDNNDTMAAALRGLPLDQVLEAVVASGSTVPDKWRHLNVGMQRMTAGNVLRRIYSEGRPVVIPATGTKLHDPSLAPSPPPPSPRAGGRQDRRPGLGRKHPTKTTEQSSGQSSEPAEGEFYSGFADSKTD